MDHRKFCFTHSGWNIPQIYANIIPLPSLSKQKCTTHLCRIWGSQRLLPGTAPDGHRNPLLSQQDIAINALQSTEKTTNKKPLAFVVTQGSSILKVFISSHTKCFPLWCADIRIAMCPRIFRMTVPTHCLNKAMKIVACSLRESSTGKEVILYIHSIDFH